MADLLQKAAFFLRQGDGLVLRSAARPGKRLDSSMRGIDFPTMMVKYSPRHTQSSSNHLKEISFLMRLPVDIPSFLLC
jgi:hypothetical protein